MVVETRQGLLSLPDFVSSGPHSHTSSTGRLLQSSKWVPPSMSSFVSIILNIEASTCILHVSNPIRKAYALTTSSVTNTTLLCKQGELNTGVANVCKAEINVRGRFSFHVQIHGCEI